MARWYRARKMLDLPAGSRVLDLGCAFGFGTRLLQPAYETYGHDLSANYIERARRTAKATTFTCGPADCVPYPDTYFDGVLLLDVLEHVPNANAVVLEISRLLRPGGQLIVSVPNRGVLAALDSLNVYQRFVGNVRPAPTDDPSWPSRPYHVHYDLRELQRLFEPAFTVRQVRYSGLGIAEPVNLVLLLLFRAIFPSPRLYAALQYVYFLVYLGEDILATGPYGYHVMLCLEKA